MIDFESMKAGFDRLQRINTQVRKLQVRLTQDNGEGSQEEQVQQPDNQGGNEPVQILPKKKYRTQATPGRTWQLVRTLEKNQGHLPRRSS